MGVALSGRVTGEGDGVSMSFDVRDLGRIAYREAWDLQKEIVAKRYAGECGDTLLVCEHDPVVTTGRGTPSGAAGEDAGGADDGAGGSAAPVLDARFEVIAVERGGEATYHGPGQIVVYPIVRLAEKAHDLHAWLRALEQAVIDTLAAFDREGTRREGATGVWTADGARKYCSIGVAASRWVTWHGLALNHTTDLSHFEAIQPCGFQASVMTSMERERGSVALPTRAEVVARLATELQRSLGPMRRGD